MKKRSRVVTRRSLFNNSVDIFVFVRHQACHVECRICCPLVSNQRRGTAASAVCQQLRGKKNSDIIKLNTSCLTFISKTAEEEVEEEVRRR